ncbi:DUF4189 domain-containing protein [Altererythrobacter sp. Z27]|uniref:DUF4189 domain-containing protein n=1 Tax=Altererythrobacter sp. Z27 TaxID=3461147 RepID=UPI004044F4BB
MKVHRHDPAQSHASQIGRNARLGLLVFALCNAVSGLEATEPDATVSAASPAAYHALAINQDYVGIWMTAGEANEDAAKARALELCRRDTGSETCQIAHSGQRNYLAVGYAIDGGLELMAQNQAAGLIESLESKCVGRFGSTCMVAGMVGPIGAKDFPAEPGPAPRRRFAAVAGDFSNVAKGAPADWRVWVVTGAESRDTAIRAASDACEGELGRTRCQIAEANGDTLLLFYQAGGTDFAGFLSEKSLARALAEMNRRCRLANRSCEVIAVANAQGAGRYVFDLSDSPEFEANSMSLDQ